MSAIYIFALSILVLTVIELITGWSVTFTGFAKRKEESERYWISIIIQAVIAIGFLIYTAIQIPNV